MWRVFLAVVTLCFVAQAARGQDAPKSLDENGAVPPAGFTHGAFARPPDITRSAENDEFGRNVIRALKSTMPRARTIGRITIRLLLDETGKLLEVRAIKTEGDPQNIAPAKYAAEMERNVLNAVKRAHFPHPPKGATISDRSFLARYVYY